ncbi:MAG: branched-chain amino acid aminotransferase [Lacibacter sp.]
MMAAMEIAVTRTQQSRLPGVDLEHIAFGKVFTDHMLEADFLNGQWTNVRIRPYQPLQLAPSNAALHYGQSIFEGIKAYRHANGTAVIFRPWDNFQRFNASARRMQMPEVPEFIFMEGMRQLIALDKEWIPRSHDHSLYIRPFLFATDEVIGVKPSDNYKFMIILSPTGPYYAKPMRIYVEEHYVRAAPGGVGAAKAAGNYAAAMYVTAEAKKKGFDQVLWMDAIEHKYVQECGTMNVFFIIGNQAITPDLSEGTILAGVTRSSVLQLLADMGYEVVERRLSIDEVVAAYQNGTLKEVFGTGTAATISPIEVLAYRDMEMQFDTTTWQAAPEVKRRLTAIREGQEPDVYEWLYKV